MTTTAPLRIDTHHHILPKEYVAQMGADRIMAPTVVKQRSRPPPNWSAEGSLNVMNDNGIDVSVVSISSPGAWLGPGKSEASGRLARSMNEFAAHLVADHPRRFGMFASLPLPDLDVSLEELEFSMDTLHADGIVLISNYDDRYLGDPAFYPVFEELNRRKAVVFVHPTDCSCTRGLLPDVPSSVIEFAQDTTRTILSLLFSGTLLRCPDIRFIFSHAGGTLPMLASRIELLQKVYFEGEAQRASQGVMSHFRRLHYDTAASANPISMAALRELVPLSQVLLGTDTPFVPDTFVRSTVAGLHALGLEPADVAAICGGNALRLFPRLAGT